MHNSAKFSPLSSTKRMPAHRANCSGWTDTGQDRRCAISIAPEFYRRKARLCAPEAELAALNHLSQFLTSEPALLLNQLAATALLLCGVRGAGVVFFHRRGRRSELTWASSAGTFAESPESRSDWKSVIESTLETQRPGIFLRFAPPVKSAGDEQRATRECLVVPWDFKPGNRGAIVISSSCADRCLDPSDLRIVSSLTCFARLAAEKKAVQERTTRGSASAARLANELAHEINNPLQALMNSLYLVSGEVANDIHLQSAREEARRVGAVVKSVLETWTWKNPWI